MSTSIAAPLELLVDGMPCDEHWPLDRGLMYGDGLFETLRVSAGRIRFESLHAARLAAGCRRLAIRADLEGIWAHAHGAARRHGEATLRLQVTRGVASARGYSPSGREVARTMLAVYPPPESSELPMRREAITLQARLGENPLLAGLKHCNRLEQVLARQELSARGGAFEGLLASSSGLLVSGTMSNVFLELDGELVTPSLDLCGVAGVLRAVVLQTARDSGVALREAGLPMDVLGRCSALAFSNARMGLVTVHALDGRTLEEDARLQQLASRVEAL